MSPTKRPSTVAGLRRGVATVQPEPERPMLPPNASAAPALPKRRVTLNLPDDLYRQLVRWTHSAEEATGIPRVGVQESMRAMVRVITGDEAPSCSARVLAELRADLGG